MRMVFGLVLLVGLALAGFAVYMAQGFISQTQNALAEERAIREKSGPLVEVYVVNKPLNYGDVLTKEDVQLIYWPENSLPEKIFRDPAVLFPDDGKEPRFILRQMEMFFYRTKTHAELHQLRLFDFIRRGKVRRAVRCFRVFEDFAFVIPYNHPIRISA